MVHARRGDELILDERRRRRPGADVELHPAHRRDRLPAHRPLNGLDVPQRAVAIDRAGRVAARRVGGPQRRRRTGLPSLRRRRTAPCLRDDLSGERRQRQQVVERPDDHTAVVARRARHTAGQEEVSRGAEHRRRMDRRHPGGRARHVDRDEVLPVARQHRGAGDEKCLGQAPDLRRDEAGRGHVTLNRGDDDRLLVDADVREVGEVSGRHRIVERRVERVEDPIARTRVGRIKAHRAVACRNREQIVGHAGRRRIAGAREIVGRRHQEEPLAVRIEHHPGGEDRVFSRPPGRREEHAEVLGRDQRAISCRGSPRRRCSR